MREHTWRVEPESTTGQADRTPLRAEVLSQATTPETAETVLLLQCSFPIPQ